MHLQFLINMWLKIIEENISLIHFSLANLSRELLFTVSFNCLKIQNLDDLTSGINEYKNRTNKKLMSQNFDF